MAITKKTIPPVTAAKETVKAESVKTTVEKVEAAKVETAKAETAKAETAKETVKKAVVKREASKKATKAAAPKKTAAKKAELKSAIHIQFDGKSYSEEELTKIAKDVWQYDLKQKVAELTSIELYVKPEENTVYYVMNKEFTGSFFI